MNNLSIFPLSFLFIFTCNLPAFSKQSQDILTEHYIYESSPLKKNPLKNFSTEMEFSHSENEVTISVKKRFHDKLEDTNLIIDNKGIIVSGTRKTTYRNSRKSRLESLRKEGTKIYIKSIYNSRTKTDEIELPEELPCAVDVSLLYLFRISIMHLAGGLKVFMVDFSGRSTKVLVKNTGTDKIIVPAGEYTCYRIDVKIRFLIFFTKITYWITKDEPHFLVKHEGKLGPFTRRYVTELVNVK